MHTLHLPPVADMNAFVHFSLSSLDGPEKRFVRIPRCIPARDDVVKYFPDDLLIMGTTKCL